MFDLKALQELYKQNVNLIEYMRTQTNATGNSPEQIMISYDIQAGSYIKNYQSAPEKKQNFLKRLTEIILEKEISGTLLEAGVGDGVSLVLLLHALAAHGARARFHDIYAFDISWSRIKAAKQFGRKENQPDIHFFTGELLNIPLQDNSFDLVYTVHAIEPNGGMESEILQELYRVCKEYLILLEPCYEFADEAARARMRKHGYVTRLHEAALELNYDVELYELYGVNSNPLNPTGIMVIRKQDKSFHPESSPPPHLYACPISKKALQRYPDSFFSPDSMLAYPIIQDIPCLLTNNAVAATHYLDSFC